MPPHNNPWSEKRGNGLCLLSFDAGGSRGISQLKILVELMHRLNFETMHTEFIRPCAIFDMIGGVGSGGFISILLVVFGLTAEEALEEFISLSVEILDVDGMDAGERTTILKEFVEKLLAKYEIVKHAGIMDQSGRSMDCKLAIPISYKKDVASGRTIRNFEARQESPLTITVADALLATMAMPPHFQPVSLQQDHATYEYVAGGLISSNPIEAIITEAHGAFGSGRHVACLLSLGCGHSGVMKALEVYDPENWKQFLGTLAVESKETAHRMESQMGHLGIYHRLSVDHGLKRTATVDQLTPGGVLAYTSSYLAEELISRRMDILLDTLMLREGVSSLGQLRHCGGMKPSPPTIPPLTSTFVMRKGPWDFINRAVGLKVMGISRGQRIIILTGMGGCGKTQLILKFMKVYGDQYASKVLIDGSDEARLKAQIIRHVRSLGLNHSYPSFEECLDLLAQAAPNGPRLIVYDNVDDPKLNILSYIPRSDHCVIIITSRIHSMGQLFPESHLELDVMSLEESVELLIRGTGRQKSLPDAIQEETIAIAQELGCLPIALRQACSYMYQTKCSERVYLSRLQQSKTTLLSEPMTYQLDMRYTSTYATFDASYEMLEIGCRKLLHLLCFFSWADFPLELITVAAEHGFSVYDEELVDPGGDSDTVISILMEIFCPSGEWNPLVLDHMMVSLQNYSLVTLIANVDTVLLQIHPVTHGWAASKLTESARPAYKCAAVLLLSMGARKSHNSLEKYLSSHVYYMASIWDQLPPNDQWAFARILLNSGNFADAALLQKRVVDHLRVYLDPLDDTFLSACRRLAFTYLRSGDREKAKQVQGELVMLMHTTLGDALLGDITGVEILADTFKASRQYVEAAKMEEEALKQSTQLNGELHPHTIGLLTDLGRSYSALGEYAKAERVETEAMMRNLHVFGENHPRTIGSCRNLARTYGNQGRYVEAERLLRKTLALSRHVCGDNHQRTLMTMYILANTLYRQERTAESSELLSEIESLEATSPGGNPEMLQKTRKLRWRILNPNRTANPPDDCFEEQSSGPERQNE